MFRISFDEQSTGTGTKMRLEGRIAGNFADEARRLIALHNLPVGFVVDLSDITFVDSAGEDALKWLSGIGARFVSENSYALHLCERLQLPGVNGKGRRNGKHSAP